MPTTNELRKKRLQAQYGEMIEKLNKPGIIDIALVKPEIKNNELLRIKVTVNQPTYLVGPGNKPVKASSAEFFMTVLPVGDSTFFKGIFLDTQSRVAHPHVWRDNVMCLDQQTNYTGLLAVITKGIKICVFDPSISVRGHAHACNDFSEWFWRMTDSGEFPTGDLELLFGGGTVFRMPKLCQ